MGDNTVFRIEFKALYHERVWTCVLGRVAVKMLVNTKTLIQPTAKPAGVMAALSGRIGILRTLLDTNKPEKPTHEPTAGQDLVCLSHVNL